MSRRIVVVGGGISGLAAAYTLTRLRSDVHVTLLEASERLGGNVKTDLHDGFVIEHGPDSFVTGKPHGVELCRELGLSDHFITTPVENRVVYFAHGGTLTPLPEGLTLGVPTSLGPFLKTPLLSWNGKLRALSEPFIRARASDVDESVHDFFTRRLGREAAERLAKPLLGGIYAGDTGSLSLLSTFPQFRELETRYGSFMLGLLASKHKSDFKPRAWQKPWRTLGLLLAKHDAGAPAFVSLRSGMGTLIDALERALPDGTVLKRAAVVALELGHGAAPRYRLRLATGDSLTADSVILATPVQHSARIVPDLVLKDELSRVRVVSTATVAFGFSRQAVAHPLRGLGFIVPEGEGKILAATWVSSKWPHRAPPGAVLLRAFVGGPRAGSQAELGDAEIAELGLGELRRLMGRLDEPLFYRVHRYPGASPQPELGHGERLRRIHARARALPGLYLTAGGLDGIGIPDSIKYARLAAQDVLNDLR